MQHATFPRWTCTSAGTLLGLSLIGVPCAQADFIADSKGSLEARNFYFNRDFRQEGARDKAEEWAQGFLLRLESGYTAGTVGFGLDALGMAGFKLDSGAARPAPICCQRICRAVPKTVMANWA